MTGSSDGIRHCEKRSDEAIQNFTAVRFLDCFAEPVIGPRFARTRWLAMTALVYCRPICALPTPAPSSVWSSCIFTVTRNSVPVNSNGAS